MNNVLTASGQNTFLSCARKYFWGNEVGLRKTFEDSPALKFGSAWARAMEARWNKATYEEALAAAIPQDSTVWDEFIAGTLSALLAAYYDYYGVREQFGEMTPEVQFSSDLGDGWTAEGKIDGLGFLADGRHGIVESKTTSDSIAPDSDYWLRTTFNVQVYQYIVEARKLGWDIATTYYDVTKKPMLRPKEFVEELDEEGLKIVLDADGARVLLKAGKNKGKPKQSADKNKGEILQGHKETPDEYCDRVYKDVSARPDYYFVRREIPVLENSIDAFIRQRFIIRDTIEFYRSKEEFAMSAFSRRDSDPRDPSAWPRNVSSDTCDYCQFKNFCLNNQTVDIQHPPQGFSVQDFNPELAK